MAKETAIAWCDSTWSPWMGCTKVSPGCDHCYASVSTPARTMRIEWGPGQPRRRTSESTWGNPLRWNRMPFYRCLECGWRGGDDLLSIVHNPPGFHPPVEWAKCCPKCDQPTIMGARRRVFCGSLCDVFDNEVSAQWRIDLMSLICQTPNLDWLLLTKRIGNAAEMLETAFRAVHHQREGWSDNVPPHVWLGATIVNQEEADRDIPKLLETPAVKRFVSYEPALGPVDWTGIQLSGGIFDALRGGEVGQSSTVKAWPALDWIIVGGESDQPGMRARPFDIQWARSTIEQCQAAGVACFVKQLGSDWARQSSLAREGTHHFVSDRAGADPAEWPEDLRVREFPR